MTSTPNDTTPNMIPASYIDPNQINWMCECIEQVNNKFLIKMIENTNKITELYEKNLKLAEKDIKNSDRIMELTNKLAGIKTENEINKTNKRKISDDYEQLSQKYIIIKTQYWELDKTNKELLHNNNTMNSKYNILRETLTKSTTAYHNLSNKLIRPCPENLITLVRARPDIISVKPCIDIINNQKCVNDSCTHAHNFEEMKHWNSIIDPIRRENRTVKRRYN